MDIEPTIRQAREMGAPILPDEEFKDLLHLLAADFPGSEIDWDEGAGESWGLIMEHGKSLILLHRELPLIFATREIASRPPLLIVVISDFNDEILQMTRAEVEELFATRILDIKAPFSVNQLWYHTV
jgi:hypothetical protein